MVKEEFSSAALVGFNGAVWASCGELSQLSLEEGAVLSANFEHPSQFVKG